MKNITTTQDVDEALGAECAILFKNSNFCPISAAARQEMQQFLERRPDAPVYVLDVNECSDVSQYVVEKTGIEHESPQVICTRGGRPEWHTSHFDIRADDLESRLHGAS
ncbi:MAG TPA: bacillithiol system redox-active protein YtxJ [Longimicrobium sp.]|nr:bacillithiol system redox-active protein YtxJ [Longimicrobium sp.]